MASDSPDSHRKHRRSTSDEDSPGNTKRHKHRHHRHHRRHRHHRSKHSDAKKDETKEDSLEEVKETVIKQSLVHDYDDMEEGEIVEDEGEIAAKKVESDVESGEFMAADDRPTDFDDSYMQNVDADSEKCETENSRKLTKYLNSPGNDQSSEDKQDGSRNRHDELAVVERVANGDHASRSRKGESRSHRSGKPPLKESRKEKDLDRSDSKQQVLESLEIDDDDGERRNSSYSHKARDARHEARYRSPFHGRHHVEITSDRSRSESPDLMRERERSQSIVTERNLKMNLRHGRDERPYENGKAGNEMGEGRDGHRGSDYHRNGREKDNDRRRERSSSYHRASAHEGKHDGDSWDSETEEKMYRGKKMVEREASKERSERNWDKEREILRIKDREREKDSVRDRDRPRDTNSDMDWDKYRGGSRERDLERERRREKDRGGSRDRDMERERRREKDRGRSRDRDFESERRRDDSISMYRDRDTQRERDRSRKLEMERGRDRHSDRDRHIGKARDEESDRSRRYNKYDDRDDSYSNRDRHRGYDEVEDKKLKPDPAKDHSLKENGVNGDDDDQKDYQDTLEVNLTEREEDDVDRIKEESRRRREAILQKYKAQTLQQQQTVPQVLKAPDQKLPEQPSQKSTGVFQEVKNGANCDVKDASSSLGDTLTAVALGEGSPKSERSNDMFCDDIFGDSPAGVRKMGKGDGLHLERSGLHDNWDDPDGYYSFRFGEVLDNRYEITAAHGKGVFSTVVRAKDLKAGSGDPEEVAIKIIRNNETMLKAGTEELVILKKLVGADRDDRRHCVRYLSNFKYRNHLCIVFESLHMNLREVLKKFGRNIGLKLTAVRTYAKQLFVALKHLRNCGVLHCDIKPDNMLVNESKNVLKLCDFGNAMFSGKNEITPYLVSRFYRAPEIILGLPYDHPMDMWSIGCCLYELYTGKVLFPGPSNNDMLRLHMELKGPFPKKMLRKGAFIEQHFDQDLNFLALEEDPVTKKAIRRLIVNIKPKDFGNIIRGSPGEDSKMLANFKDLMDKIFVLDPDKRLTVSQALTHPFITGK